ncbi:hypothetical protein ACJMK2_017303 [Sinanodonta woodiana]|uniref:Sushi domain-containing protein n=1 Tax=Sinanodonta woodiana TaxID=1069815 RepID=A0ABD3UWF5_SINWO
MYGKFRFSMNGFIYFLMWSIFNLNVTCGFCPAVFNGGYIDPSCTNEMVCNFFCNPGFVKTDDMLFCVKGEYWFPNPISACIKKVTCPLIFNNGYIQSTCSRLPGDSCNFICDPGFVKKGNQLTCGQDGMWIQDMNSICIKSSFCPAVFIGGYIDPSCRNGIACNFYCNPGLVKTDSVLFCVKGEYWLPNPSSACIKKVNCPVIFNNGYIQSTCSRLPGDSCNFICNPGFVKKGNQLTCGQDGMWIQDMNSSCIKSDTCPDVLNGGYIDPFCSRRPGLSCNINCYPEFVKIGYFLTCGNNGSWIQDTNSICIKSEPCPDVFNGGYVVPSCSRVPGDSCTFNCNPGFVKKGNLLTCGIYRNWIPDTNSICVQSITCPDEFNGGYIEPYCSRHPGDSCTFYCYPEFVKKGYWLTCGNNGSWIQDTNSICIKSVEPMPSYNEPRPTGPLHVGAIVGISTAILIVMIIIVTIVVWRAKRSSVRKSQRVPGHAGATCLRPRENRDQSVTTLQQPNTDVINSVSSFESPSYNGIYVHSFDQRIPTVSSSCRYYEPPPSYSEIHMAANEAPPTYIEAVSDPTRFNLYI